MQIDNSADAVIEKYY